MYHLNLDPTFSPDKQVKSLKFESFIFSGGEPHIKLEKILPKEDCEVTISHRITSFNDLGLLIVAVDAVKRMFKPKNLVLFLPYFPGARQDRIMVQGEAFTLKCYADIINNLNFSKVYVVDPHSDVTPALVNNIEVINNHCFVKKVLYGKEINFATLPLLVSPDAGSNKKIKDLGMSIGNIEILKCDKTREVATGKITGFEVYSYDIKGKDCLIVDDICDGGGTFNGLAAELKKKGAGKLYLAVTHGIFSKGFKELNKNFDGIFTTDSFPSIDNPYFCMTHDNTYHKLTQYRLDNVI